MRTGRFIIPLLIFPLTAIAQPGCYEDYLPSFAILDLEKLLSVDIDGVSAASHEAEGLEIIEAEVFRSQELQSWPEVLGLSERLVLTPLGPATYRLTVRCTAGTAVTVFDLLVDGQPISLDGSAVNLGELPELGEVWRIEILTRTNRKPSINIVTDAAGAESFHNPKHCASDKHVGL